MSLSINTEISIDWWWVDFDIEALFPKIWEILNSIPHNVKKWDTVGVQEQKQYSKTENKEDGKRNNMSFNNKLMFTYLEKNVASSFDFSLWWCSLEFSYWGTIFVSGKKIKKKSAS